jgi:hypothetical protein
LKGRLYLLGKEWDAGVKGKVWIEPTLETNQTYLNFLRKTPRLERFAVPLDEKLADIRALQRGSNPPVQNDSEPH